MTVLRRCLHCDTALAHDLGGGRVVIFRAHDDAFCAAATRGRVQTLVRALADLHEVYARHVRALHARVDELLAEAGLPSLRDRAERARLLALLRADLTTLGPTPAALDDLGEIR